MHVYRTRTVGAALLLMLILAACGGTTSSASGEPSSGGSVASIEPTAEPTEGASAGPTRGAVEDLEALIPDEIGAITLQKFSMKGDAFVGSGSATDETQEFLQSLGVSPDDVAVAFGFGVSSASGDGMAVFLFRARGVGSDRLVTVFMDATDAQREAPLDWQSTTVSGKGVYRANDPEQNNQTVYLYAVDDTLVFLAATQDADAAEALAALP